MCKAFSVQAEIDQVSSLWKTLQARSPQKIFAPVVLIGRSGQFVVQSKPQLTLIEILLFT